MSGKGIIQNYHTCYTECACLTDNGRSVITCLPAPALLRGLPGTLLAATRKTSTAGCQKAARVSGQKVSCLLVGPAAAASANQLVRTLPAISLEHLPLPQAGKHRRVLPKVSKGLLPHIAQAYLEQHARVHLAVGQDHHVPLGHPCRAAPGVIRNPQKKLRRKVPRSDFLLLQKKGIHRATWNADDQRVILLDLGKPFHDFLPFGITQNLFPTLPLRPSRCHEVKELHGSRTVLYR